MSVLVVLFIIVFVIGFLIAATVLARSGQSGNSISQRPEIIDWEAINDEVVQAEMAKGNKIGAIKRYRLLSGQGLKDSKDAIEYALLHPDESGDKKKKAAYDARDAGIRDLIQDGRLDEAVEIYQRFAGVDAYTARDAVDEIARDLHLSHQSASRVTFEVPPPSNKSNSN